MARKNRRGFGAIRKLPSGKWQASYLTPSGGRVNAPMTFTAWVDADSYLNTIRYEIEKGLWVDEKSNEQKGGQLCFREYALRHIELQIGPGGEGLRASTKSHYKTLLKNHLEIFGDLSLEEIKKPMVDEWYSRTSSSGIKTTASKAYKLLSAIMSRAVGDELIVKNPCAIKGAQSATTGKIRDVPSTPQLDLLISNLNPRYRELFLFSALLGMRFSEVSELRVKDFRKVEENGESKYILDISRGSVLVDGAFVIGKTKTKKSTRVSHIPTSLAPLVEKLLRESGESGPETLLFPSASGNNLRNDVFAKALNRAKKLSGLSDKFISHHSLRHYGGTQFGATGASLADVKEYLGQSSTAAAIRYLHSTGRGVQLVEAMPVPESIELLTSEAPSSE